MTTSAPDNANDVPDNDLEFSCIIPAYNEELRLSQTLLSALEYFDGRFSAYEIIIVDDGSSDGTARIVRQFERLSSKIKLLRCPTNRGKGFAVRLGVMNARGRLILFADADGATPFEEFARLESAINAGAHVAFGSRALPSEDTRIKTVWYRKVIGRIFNSIVNIVLLPGVADTQCGFKLFRYDAARYLFSRQQADGFSFDVEVLFLARISGTTVTEVPVNWINIPGSKVNLITDSAHMFLDILKFKFRHITGHYKISANMPASVSQP